jgi:hypothetical protein
MEIKSFIYPEIRKSDRNFAGLFPAINPNKNWINIAINELQSQHGIEPSSCYVEAQQAIIATLLEYIYGIKDSNFSARFNALLSDGTHQGGDPIKAALSIKKDGLIPQSMMGWNDVKCWNDFHSWKGVDKEQCLLEGKNFVNQWDMSYRIVFEKDTPLKTKYLLLEEALKCSPVAVSVYAWVEKDGVYYKPEGVRDTHLTMVAVGMNDKGQVIVRDTYEPFYKTLAKDTDFEFAIGWSVRKRNPQEMLDLAKKNIIIVMYELVKRLLIQIKSVSGEIISGIFDGEKPRN